MYKIVSFELVSTSPKANNILCHVLSRCPLHSSYKWVVSSCTYQWCNSEYIWSVVDFDQRPAPSYHLVEILKLTTLWAIDHNTVRKYSRATNFKWGRSINISIILVPTCIIVNWVAFDVPDQILFTSRKLQALDPVVISSSGQIISMFFLIKPRRIQGSLGNLYERLLCRRVCIWTGRGYNSAYHVQIHTDSTVLVMSFVTKGLAVSKIACSNESC